MRSGIRSPFQATDELHDDDESPAEETENADKPNDSKPNEGPSPKTKQPKPIDVDVEGIQRSPIKSKICFISKNLE